MASTSYSLQSKHIKDIKTSLVIVNSKPHMVTLDYEMDVSSIYGDDQDIGRFRLSYYPHRLQDFTGLLHEAFGPDARHEVFADFRLPEQESNPAFYIHVIEKV
jgi:glycine N-methyltransferase